MQSEIELKEISKMLTATKPEDTIRLKSLADRLTLIANRHETLSYASPVSSGVQNGGRFALITKKRKPEIIIIADDIEDYEQAIETLYWNKKGFKPSGNNWTKEEMLQDYKKVKIYFEQL
ncbi:MAG: hypothetical protein PHU86_03805 [Patescibacteria group bacterium]|nr:hypothetical protein [Patescibacteria group bacterium]